MMLGLGNKWTIFSSSTIPYGPYIQDPELLPNNILSGTTLSGINANILIEEIIKILVYLKIPLSNNENNSPNLSNISNILDRFYSNMLN